MADEQTTMTEEQTEALRKLTEQQLEHIRSGKALIDIQWDNFLKYTKMGRGLKQVDDSVKDFGSGMKSAAKNVAGSGGAFTDLSGAVEGTIKAITGLLGNIPLVGGAIKGLGEGLAEATTFAIEQVQTGFTGFQEMSQIGQIGSEGITGLVNDFRGAGVSIKTYTDMLKENSENLAYFSESALEGGATFAKTMTRMTKDTGKPLRRLGFTVEEIGETVVDFQKMQRLMGVRQQLSQAELEKQSISYGKELDLIAKLTGKNRKDIQKEREAALSDARFRAKIASLEAEGKNDEARALTDYVNIVKQQSPEMGRALQDMSTGLQNTEAARKAIASGMGQTLMDQVDLITSGNIGVDKAINNTVAMADQVAEVGGAVHQAARAFESGAGPFINFAELMDVAGMTPKNLEKARERQEKLAAATEGQTEQLIDANMKMQDTASAMNALFLKTGIATATVNGFATVLNKTVAYIEQTILGKDAPGKEKSFMDKGWGDHFESFKVSLKEGAERQQKIQDDMKKGYHPHHDMADRARIDNERLQKQLAEMTPEERNALKQKNLRNQAKKNPVAAAIAKSTVSSPLQQPVVPVDEAPVGPTQAERLAALQSQKAATEKEIERKERISNAGFAEHFKTDAEARKDGILSKEERAIGNATLSALHSIEQEIKGLRGLTKQQAKEIKELKQITKNAS